MRSIIRSLTIAGLIVGSTEVSGAQVGGRAGAPRRPVPPAAAERTEAARERALELRERALERREAMLERQLGRDVGPPGRPGMRGGPGMGRGPGMGPGFGPGRGPEFRQGVRAGARAGMRAGMRMGRAGGRPGLRERVAIGRRAVAADRIRNLTDEQRTALRKFQDEATAQRRSVSDKVRAGTLTREQARAEMQKWRETNKPPVDLRRPPEGSER